MATSLFTPSSADSGDGVAAVLAIPAREWRWVVLVSAPILVATVVLNVIVPALTPPAYRFLGFVYAWDDGAGYLAAMREGAGGAWLFTLPYTAQHTDAFFLYAQYILLGHLAAGLALEPVVVYHLARLAASALLLASLYVFLGRVFREPRERRLAFLLAGLGSGFGWLALISGHLSPDLWQYEAFVFLSMLSSPHLALGMACFLWLMDLLSRDAIPLKWSEWLRLAGGAAILAAIQPYALVVVAVVIGAWLCVQWVHAREIIGARLLRLAVVVLSAAPLALYYVWAQANVPAFAGWQAQDITLSPPPTDYLIAGGLPLAFALVGAALTARQLGNRPEATSQGTAGTGTLLLVWLFLGSLLLYEPLTHHQRRFAFGLSIPVACLAVYGYRRLCQTRLRVSAFSFVTLCSLTSLALLVQCFALAQQHPAHLFVTRGEWNALMYLRTQPGGAVVLASPLMGLFIPAWSDQRVVFGHPHETLDAAMREHEVEQFFSGTLPDAEAFLIPVDYILAGPRERALGTPTLPNNYRPVFSEGDVTLYARR